MIDLPDCDLFVWYNIEQDKIYLMSALSSLFQIIENDCDGYVAWEFIGEF